MKKRSLLKTMLLLCAIIVGSSAWAEDPVFEFSLNNLYQNRTKVTAKTVIDTKGGTLTFTDENENFTILLTRNSGNEPGFYTSSGYFRFYNSDTFKLSAADGITITKIVITPNGSSFSLSAQDGLNTSTKTWTGSASEVTFTGSGTNKWDKITITYTSDGGSNPTPTCVTPTFDPAEGTYTSAQNVTISTTTEDATIYYTTDGTTPTTSSSTYSSAIPISTTTTIKAIAVADGYNKSTVASATYTINLPYVRVNSLDYLTDGAKVIIAARYNTTANAYYAMTATTSGKPTGVAFTSTTTSKGEELPSSILNDASTYYWTVGVTSDGYTFTNSDDKSLGYTSSTDFSTGGNNTEWTITRVTSGSSAMVGGYEGFYIINKNNTGRGIALNSSHNYGPYSTSSNNNSSSYNFYLDIFVEGATPASDPSISADDVNIAYDATSGSISYTLSNEPSPAGTLTAAITAGNEGSWLSLGAVSTTVPLTCAANNTASARTATVTLTYTYGENQTVTKNVTITQAGNPDAYDNISDITAVSSTYKVKGTVVATNAKGFVIGDGTGYVYTYLNAAPTQLIGDKVTINGTTGSYGHIIQFTSSATIAAATTSNYDNTPAVTVVDDAAIAAYNSDYQLSDYVQLEGSLAKTSNNYYEITVGTETARISYPTTTQTTALEALVNKDVRVKGYFAGFSSSKFTIMMESVEEIFIPKLSIDPATVDPFEYEEGGDLSNEQTFTVSGENLTGDITVSVTGEFDLRGPSSGYGNTSLTLSNGDEFGVNMNANLTEGSYNGTLTIASEGATSIVIELTGTVGPYVAPAITATETTVNVSCADGMGTINMNYTKIDTDLVDVEFYESDGTTSATYDWIDAEIDADNNLYYTVDANSGEARTAYLKVYGLDDNGGDDFIYSQLITITQAKYEYQGSWVAANLADINENDVFVIVGNAATDAYALPNNYGTSAPGIVNVSVENNTLKGTIDENIQWNVSGNATNGYTFYPNGTTKTWLYCSTNAGSSSNNNIKVGTGDRKSFILDEKNYLVTNDDYTTRYLSVYVENSTPKDWRGYVNTNSAVEISFYKKLAAKLNAFGYATFSATVPVDFSLADGFTAWAITAISGTSITFSQITGAVPAGTGVLLKGTAGETVYPAATTSGTAPSTNLLVAFATATDITANQYYGLSGENFVKLTAGTVPAGKALLPASVVDNSSRLSLVFEEASGISQIENGRLNAEDSVYNLNGQRIVNPTKGLYIVNGKKVMVK